MLDLHLYVLLTNLHEYVVWVETWKWYMGDGDVYCWGGIQQQWCNWGTLGLAFKWWLWHCIFFTFQLAKAFSSLITFWDGWGERGLSLRFAGFTGYNLQFIMQYGLFPVSWVALWEGEAFWCSEVACQLSLYKPIDCNNICYGFSFNFHSFCVVY